MIYTAKTKNSGLRIRTDHYATGTTILGNIANAHTPVTSTELWEATESSGETLAGDKWLKVTHNGITGWIAYVHRGVSYLYDFVEKDDTPTPTTPNFPDWFNLVDPDGNVARYELVK